METIGRFSSELERSWDDLGLALGYNSKNLSFKEWLVFLCECTPYLYLGQVFRTPCRSLHSHNHRNYRG